MDGRIRTILIVDDVELNRAILREMFISEYEVLEAENGQIALDLIVARNFRIDMLLLDVLMPVLDGFGVMESMRKYGQSEHIPIILITAESTDTVLDRGYYLGAADIISKPFNPDIVRRRVKNVLTLYSRQLVLEEMVLQKTESLKIQSRYLVDALSSIIEFKNAESGQHIQHIRRITKFLLHKLSKEHAEYRISRMQMEDIAEAAAMHDIGKIAIPDEVLNKPGKLTAEEFDIMKTHTTMGPEVAKKLEHIRNQEFLDFCMDICRHHHERWDGKGYPDGLKGEAITIWSQVVSLADVYDALTNPRVYKEAYSHETSLQMIENGECGQFNPLLLDCLMEHAQELREFLNSDTENDMYIWESRDQVGTMLSRAGIQDEANLIRVQEMEMEMEIEIEKRWKKYVLE